MEEVSHVITHSCLLCVSTFYAAAPVITTTQSSISAFDVVIGYPLTLACISSGSPPDKFIWMKDGVLITKPTSITPVNHTSTSAIFRTNYTINNLAVSDNGTYTCIVSNPIGRDSHSITVYVCKYLSN